MPPSERPPLSLTELLHRHNAGAPEAMPKLIAAVYDDLCRMAGRRLRRERADHTLDPHALVHEAYARLSGGAAIEWTDRRHFFLAFARSMRRVLCDHARRYRAAKRGGDVPGFRVDALDDVADRLAAPDTRIHLVLSIAEALRAMEADYPRLVRLVELRFFCGLTIDETAHILGRSSRSVQRDWRAARVLLKARLGEPD